MGNFEKLSVVVIVVIIVMILAVAFITWTDDPEDTALRRNQGSEDVIDPDPEPMPPDPVPMPPDPVPVPPDPIPVPPAPAPAPTPGPEPTPGPTPDGPEFVEYVVASGDSLGEIAQRHGLKASQWRLIAEANGIDGSMIRVGQTLRIPTRVPQNARSSEPSGERPAPSADGPAPRPGATYVVRSGDTLQSISKVAYGSTERWPDIWLENLSDLPSDTDLRPGMTIRIPE